MIIWMDRCAFCRTIVKQAFEKEESSERKKNKPCISVLFLMVISHGIRILVFG